MPMAQFSEGLRNILRLLPGTYGVGIMRNHYMGGYLSALADAGVPSEAIDGIKVGFDVKVTVFNSDVSLGGMYAILLGSCAVLLAAYVAIVLIKNRKK